MRKSFSSLLTGVMLTACLSASAQRNEILSDRIATLQVVAGSDWLSPPITFLGGSPINISFDDLTHEYHRYTYKITHCEADWSESDGLFESDYIAGFTDGNIIEDSEESLNTNELYTHYRLTIPNSQCRLTMSGNYRLTVYDDNNDDEAMLTACFMVVEPLAGVSLTVSPNTDIDVNKSHQQVSMSVSYGSLTVSNPYTQLHTVVMQNGRWDNAVVNAQPTFTRADGLQWEHCRDLIFDASNEYHKFEVLDTDHPTLGIDRIRWDGTRFHAYVMPDEPRPNYLYDEDANGAFYIRNSDNIENDRLTDYVVVHFELLCNSPIDTPVYLNGVWTNNQLLPQYEMEYDEAARSYRCAIPLKMGYYSYQYITVDDKGYTHNMPTEGNFFQTENAYQALVYYREPGGRADRLVGYQQVHTKW